MKQRGIALVQVLLFSAVLSVISLYFSNLAKEQVVVAQAANNKTEAFIELHSARQHLLFNLLVTEKQLTTSPEQPYGWNFFGDSFSLTPTVNAQLFDLSSKLNIRYPTRERLTKLLDFLGMDNESIRDWIANLLDYQDLDTIGQFGGGEHLMGSGKNRNGPLSDKSELRKMGLEDRTLNELVNNVSIYRNYEFNPINASPTLLEALYGAQVMEKVMTLRKVPNLTKAEFIEQTYIKEEEGVFIFPSNDFQITLTSTVQGISLSQSWTVRLRPYASNKTSPVNILIINEL
jgi:general secretion pathway protein K